jgi:prepilin-type N-terminal cleavage/methylation domain-containing protein
MKQKIRQYGFTLIEVLFAMIILVVLSIILISSFRTNDKVRRVNATHDTLINLFRNAQNYALTARQITTSSCVIGGTPDKSPVAYQVFIDSARNSFELQARDKCSGIITVERIRLVQFTRIWPLMSVVAGGSTTPTGFIIVEYTTPFAATQVRVGISGTFMPYQTITIPVMHSTDSSVAKSLVVDGISGKIGE